MARPRAWRAPFTHPGVWRTTSTAYAKNFAALNISTSYAKACWRRTPSILKSFAKHFDVTLLYCLANVIEMFGLRRCAVECSARRRTWRTPMKCSAGVVECVLARAAECLASDIEMFGAEFKSAWLKTSKCLAFDAEMLLRDEKLGVHQISAPPSSGALSARRRVLGKRQRNVWRSTSKCLARRNTWRT